MRNKTMEINSAILSSQSQLITSTESWIQTSENDDFLIKECLPENYIPLSFPREFLTGGGILFIHRIDISISVIQNLCNQDFEIVTCRVLSLNYPIFFICCYRPISGNLQLFLEEFHGLLVKFSSEYILCCGDFNIHVNRICQVSTDFKDILDEFGLVQSVELPTYKNGNTLDLVIGPQKFEICLVSVSTSDHNWLNFDCLKHLENSERSIVKFRIWKNVNLVDFNEDCFYHLWSIEGSPLIDSVLETLQPISDKHAPGMERVISKHNCPFYDNELRACKRKRRQLERLFRKTRSTINRLHMQIATENYFKLFHKKRSMFLEKKLIDADTSKLKFAAIENLLGSKKKQTLPSVFPRVKLANKFNDFFLSKIQNIPKNIPPVLVDLKFPASADFLETFENVDNLYVVLVSNQVSSKSQPSQNVPSKILKKMSFFYNQMSEIINESFLNAAFPTAFKHGIVTTIFKSGDIEEISNYRPITNLHFASKGIEKVIALQLKRFLDKHTVIDEHQSAYRKYHSTETALLDLTSNLLWGLNNKSTFLVISLDLSAAFDTVDHVILLSILFQIGIIGQAHSLIKSYLNGRTQ